MELHFVTVSPNGLLKVLTTNFRSLRWFFMIMGSVHKIYPVAVPVANSRMHRELEERLGCKVDLVEEGTLRPAVAAAAQKDMKMIYERGA